MIDEQLSVLTSLKPDRTAALKVFKPSSIDQGDEVIGPFVKLSALQQQGHGFDF